MYFFFVGYWIVDVDGDVGRTNKKYTFTRVENCKGEISPHNFSSPKRLKSNFLIFDN